MEKHILYSFRRCPYAIRARWALLMTGQVVIYREVLLSNKPRELLQISPKGTVPVLVTSKGEIIDESIDIMNWALQENDQRNIARKEDNHAQNEIRCSFCYNTAKFQIFYRI